MPPSLIFLFSGKPPPLVCRVEVYDHTASGAGNPPRLVLRQQLGRRASGGRTENEDEGRLRYFN
jgi:hypothetical protein